MSLTPQFDHLTLIFENCESIQIAPEHILGFEIIRITDNAWSNIVHQYNTYKTAEQVRITLKDSALELKMEYSDTLGKRLQLSQDITGVEIVRGENKLHVHVPYHDPEDKLVNLLQHTTYNKGYFVLYFDEAKKT